MTHKLMLKDSWLGTSVQHLIVRSVISYNSVFDCSSTEGQVNLNHLAAVRTFHFNYACGHCHLIQDTPAAVLTPYDYLLFCCFHSPLTSGKISTKSKGLSRYSFFRSPSCFIRIASAFLEHPKKSARASNRLYTSGK